MSKFKAFDKITAIERGRGFEEATVLNIFTAKKGRFKGREMYYVKIMNGTATIPISAEENYELVNKK